MTRIALSAAALTVAGLGATLALARGDSTSAATVAPAVTHSAVQPATTCSKPTPTTAAGYAAMFAAVPTSQWGGADVSISVRVGGTNVWLWGDTISQVTSWPFTGANGRFVHSSAISQTLGCAHVSHAGAQLLPNDADGSWYWIKSAAAVDSTHLRITADHVVRTGPGAWDFKVVGERTATASLNVTGDVTFTSWTGAAVPVQHIVQKDGGIYAPWTSTVSEISNGKVLATGLPHTTANFSYAPFVHTGTAHLASGKVLLTVCQNSSPLNSYAGYRPIFSEVTL